MNKFEFRKYGNGSQCYEVFIMKSYDELTKTPYYTSIGFVQKQDNEWIAMDGLNLSAKTRKELVLLLEEKYLNEGLVEVEINEDLIHINELLEGSAVYDDVEGIEVKKVYIQPDTTVVSYSYDGNEFLDVWNACNGMIPVNECHEATASYDSSMSEYKELFNIITKTNLNKWLEETGIELNEIISDINSGYVDSAMVEIKEIALSIKDEFNNISAIKLTDKFISYEDAQNKAREILKYEDGLVRVAMFVNGVDLESADIFHVSNDKLHPVTKEMVTEVLNQVLAIATELV